MASCHTHAPTNNTNNTYLTISTPHHIITSPTMKSAKIYMYDRYAGRLTEDENEKVLDNIAKKFRKTLLINLLTS